MSSAYSPGSTVHQPPVGQLDRVAAALAREQRLDRHREHVLAPLDARSRRRPAPGRGVPERPGERDRHLDRRSRPRPAWSRPCRRRRSARPPCGRSGSSTVTRVARARELLAARVERDRHAPLVRGDLGERRPGRGLVADRGLRLADPVGARPEHDLAAARACRPREPARLLEALDRRGRVASPSRRRPCRDRGRARAGCARAGGRPRRRSCQGAKSRQAGSSP